MSTFLKTFALFFGANVICTLVIWLLVLAAAFVVNPTFLMLCASFALVQTYFTKRSVTQDIAAIKAKAELSA